MKRQRFEQAAAPYRSKQRSAVSLRIKSSNGGVVEDHAAQQPQQQQKRNKNRGKPEHDEDDKLLHQATLTAAREAKAVKAFLLQKAVRKRKDAKDPDAALQEIDAIKRLSADAITAKCLRSLGLSYTGEEGSRLIKQKLGEDDSERTSKLLEKAMQFIESSQHMTALVASTDNACFVAATALQHKRILELLKEFNRRAMHRRRTKLAIEQGRPPPMLHKKSKRKGPAPAPAASTIHMGDGAVFVESLSGSGISSSYDTVNSRSGSSSKPLKPLKRPLAAAAPRPAKRQKLAGDGNSKAKAGTTATATNSTTAATTAVKSVKQPALLSNGSSSSSSKAGVDREREQGEGLHGSWAARRLQKEKEAGALIAFAGKRTTFDDSD
eukprot:13634-Heterococcus_DN1.PRE.1